MNTIQLTIPVEVRQMNELGKEDLELVTKAIDATGNSYAPYSNFHVGACLRLSNGTSVIGANQENAAYPVGLCAERTALFAAQAQHPELSVLSIAIAARNTSGELTEKPISPCGSCRQAILEVEERYNQPVRILLYGRSGIYILRTIKDLLPLCFVSEDLDGK